MMVDDIRRKDKDKDIKKHDDVMGNMLGLSDMGKRDDDSEFYKAIQQLYEGKNLHFITELGEKDIQGLMKLHVLDRFCDSKVPVVKLMILKMMQLRVSKERKGRMEFFDSIKPNPIMGMDGMGGGVPRRGMMGRMFSPMR